MHQLLYTGKYVRTTPECNVQVFNSFVLWLLSRYSAEQLREYADVIQERLETWMCPPDTNTTYDGYVLPDYAILLKQKLSEESEGTYEI